MYRWVYQKTAPESCEYEWVQWEELIDENTQFSKHLKPQEILVQTQDTKRYQYLFRKFVDHRIPSLFCGPTGTGKTMYIKNVIQSYDPSVYTYNELGFSA